jgi:hypothetical protein
MMKASLFLIFLFLGMGSCKKDEPAIEVCDLNDPVRNLPWLRNLVKQVQDKKETEITTITLTEIGSKPVINYYISYMSCIGCISYYCDGTKVDLSAFSSGEVETYYMNLSGQSGKNRILWPE